MVKKNVRVESVDTESGDLCDFDDELLAAISAFENEERSASTLSASYVPSTSIQESKKRPPVLLGKTVPTPKRRKVRSTWNPQPENPCPFYKRVEGTTFFVDAFAYGKVPGCTAYFLSHYHSDHYGGLRKGFSDGPLYCSHATANLIRLNIGVDESYLRRLNFNEPTLIENATVTLFDANQ